jgi:ElaB/YqjD/DUF883 family membrane-anchored ribosome-binding protein
MAWLQGDDDMSSVINETVDEIGPATVGDFINRATNVVGFVVKSADGYVRSNPWAAVGAVALAAIAAGMVFSRRPRHRLDDDTLAELSGR